MDMDGDLDDIAVDTKSNTIDKDKRRCVADVFSSDVMSSL